MTGGTGFIGSHAVEQLLQRGCNVRCLVRESRQHLGWLENLPVEIVRADFANPTSLQRAVEGVDYVFHIAGLTKAKRRQDFFTVNVGSTRSLLEALSSNSRLKKFCLVSSLTAVGPSHNGVPPDESTPCHPITAYGVSKLEAERVCRQFGSVIPFVILRPPTVYGPRDRDVLEAFRWVSKGIEPSIGAARKHISIIHSSDFVRGMIDATFDERTVGETYFVTDERVYEFKELVTHIAAILEKRTIRVRIPSPMVFALAGLYQAFSLFSPSPPVLNIDKARDLVQPHWVCTGRKLNACIGYTTNVKLEEGFAQVAAWYKEHGWL